MLYKVGDEVLVRAKVVRIDKVPSMYPYLLHPRDKEVKFWMSEERMIPADKTYEQGSADAWNLLKKVYDMKCETIEQIFGVEGGFWDVIRDFTYEEALAKIEAYEKEKEIKVGDVVRTFGGIIVGAVTRVNSVNSENAHVVWADGATGDYMKSHLVKTGKHIDIESLLRQIGE